MTFYGPTDSIDVFVLVVPALIFWLVTLVRVNRAKEPRDADGRRMAVDEQQVLAAQRLNRRALIVLIVTTLMAFVISLFV